MTRTASQVLLVVAAALLLAVVPFVLPPFYVRVGQLMIYSAGLGVAWAILGGFAGYASFGQSGLHRRRRLRGRPGRNALSGIPTVLLLPIGVLVAAPVVACCRPSLPTRSRGLRGTFFAIAMLGVSHVCAELTNNIDFFEGSLGLTYPRWCRRVSIR